MTTETSQTWVNPNGTFETERYMAPERLRRGDRWIPVDITLEPTAGGGVAAKAHPGNLTLAAGRADAGEHELVALGDGVSRTAVAWSGKLPEPKLEGSTATYGDVLPSVDLVVEATRTGYKLVWVVKDRAGLASVGSIPMALHTAELSAAADEQGAVVYRDRAGTVVGSSARPMMWDSTVDEKAQIHTRQAPVGLALRQRSAGVLDAALTPDAEFLKREDLKFPVYIDPPGAINAGFDAFVQTGYGSDQSGSTELRLGTYDGGNNIARSFVQFDTTGLAGSAVSAARLNLWENYSWSCSPRTWLAFRSPAVSSSLRWSNQPAPAEFVGQSGSTTGYNSSCGDWWVGIDVGPALDYSARNNLSTATIMLAADDESDNFGWKKFNSLEAGSNPPHVNITYDPPPNTPTEFSVLPCYSLCGADAKVSSVTPTLRANITDASATQNLWAQYEVRNKATQAAVATSGNVASSNDWRWQVSTALTSGVQYEWRARGSDGVAYGGWSSWVTFTVDTTKPGVPHVSGSPYANDGQPHGAAAVAGTFSLTPASGTTDLAAMVYTLTSPTATLIAETTVATTTGLPSLSLTPPADGNLTLSVRAKDSAGNMSDPNLYQFKVGAAAMAQPLPNAQVARRMKLSVDSAIAEYTRGYFEYRRGPGGAVLTVPSAYLTTAVGVPLTAAGSSPAVLASMGGYAVWSAADTLGSAEGVVEVRAQLYTDTSPGPVFATPWVRVTVDRDADGAASTSVGPGSVNLLTGDYGLSSTDTDDLGLSVGRTTSSRRPTDGYQKQQELLNANQRQISTDTSTFIWDGATTLARVTDRGQGDSTDALAMTTSASSTQSFAAIGADTGAVQLGMRAGKRYRAQAWIYVPAATGLTPANADRGERIMFHHRTGSGPYFDQVSFKADVVDAWQELTLDFTVPVGATEAFIRLFNGNTAGKTVYWDNLSLRELVAPFGPSWSGGATGGPAASEYTTLEFPQPSLAQVNVVGGGAITFSRNADNVSFTPAPGAEGLVLSKQPDANIYRITEVDGSFSEFTLQGPTWTLASSRTTGTASTTRYTYDTANFRTLIKKVINPVEPGVDDANSCTGTLQPGCEVLEYVYATATTTGLSQTVFGDIVDQVKQVKLWASDPGTGAISDTVVTEYRYDVDGELREVWDPRVSPPLKTTYDYGAGSRVTSATPPGELPWQFVYANPDVDSASVRWDFDQSAGTTAPDTSGNSRDGAVSNGIWATGNSADAKDGALAFNGSNTTATHSGGSGIATNQSFTISAWANSSETGSTQRTVVTQDGGNVASFILHRRADGYWAFTRYLSDTPGNWVQTLSSTPSVPGQWTHLTGVYDATAGRIYLYVNGALNSSVPCSCAWNATGALVAGREFNLGSSYYYWLGGIDDIRAYPKALTAEQIANLAGDENPGRLIKVTRQALQQESPTTVDGTISTNVVYHVPLTTGAGGPHNLDAATAATWAQSELPTDATAVFGPQDTPARNSATPSSPGTGGYTYATIHYLNPNGREVNTATPGKHIDTLEYDKFGNTIRTLQATDREIALGTHPDAVAYQADLGLAALTSSARAMALSSTSIYSTDGLDLLETTGPTMTVIPETTVPDPDGAGPLPALSAGQPTIARAHTVNTYDQNKPDGASYHLVTTSSNGAAKLGYPDFDTRTTTTAYDAAAGGTSGWVLRKPTTVVADAGTGGMALTSQITYDATGRATASWGVGSTGTDARATTTIYYTANINPADAACGNTPKWAGQPCVTKKAGAVTGHDPARMATSLPERRVTKYARWGDVEIVTETVPGTSPIASRTTTTDYDAAGRIVSVALTASNDGTAAINTVTTDYSTGNGQATKTMAGGGTIERKYDLLGRVYQYTDADGGTTTNEYDRYGKPTKVSDPTGNATFAYDRSAEPRGFLTSTTDSIAGAFSAEYSPDGQLTVLHYPNGMTRTDSLDANLKPIRRAYTRDSDGAVIYSDSVISNASGEVINQSSTGGSRTYAYDRIGRLATATDNVYGSGCSTRTYAYDSRTNRTSRKTYNPDINGACRSTGVIDAQADHTYDSADRATDAGYTYDSFGRVTAAPNGLTSTYFANDRIASQLLDSVRQDWTLDPQHRFRSFTTSASDGITWTNNASRVNHYGDDSDNPSWIVENVTTGMVTRMIDAPDGNLGATTTGLGDAQFQVLNLHDDVATTVDASLMPSAFASSDEFGAFATGGQPQRYGWLGGKQRSSEALGGTILMGVRVYQPADGRFTSMDPIVGGSATAYDYVNQDPVNTVDLDGRAPSGCYLGYKPTKQQRDSYNKCLKGWTNFTKGTAKSQATLVRVVMRAYNGFCTMDTRMKGAGYVVAGLFSYSKTPVAKRLAGAVGFGASILDFSCLFTQTRPPSTILMPGRSPASRYNF